MLFVKKLISSLAHRDAALIFVWLQCCSYFSSIGDFQSEQFAQYGAKDRSADTKTVVCRIDSSNTTDLI